MPLDVTSLPRWPIPQPDSLRVLTLNVWFGEKAQDQRTRELMRVIQAHEPDVIGLQELTPEVLGQLQQSAFIQAHYSMPERPLEPLASHGYGVGLLVRDSPPTFHHRTLPSIFGRSLLWAHVGSGPARVAVGTVHLESTRPEGAARIEQLELCKATLAAAGCSVLMGDFNFGEADPEQGHISADWVDLWDVGGRGEGFTVDGLGNRMRSTRGSSSKRERYDRILLHDPARRWRLRSIERVGVEPFAPELWLSDHFGLIAELTRV